MSMIPGAAHPLSWFLSGRFGATAIPDPDPVLPATFPMAVRDALMGDGMVAGALRGGLWFPAAPAKRPGTGYPFATFEFRNINRDDLTNRGDFLETGLLRISVVGLNRDNARRIADRMMNLLARAELEFEDGWHQLIRPENPTQTSKPFHAPGAATGWEEIRGLRYEWQGWLPFPGRTYP